MGLRQLIREQQKTIRVICLAFLLLSLTSAFRQIMQAYFPESRVTPCVVYIIHTLLLAVWGMSVRNRVTILHIRRFVLLANLCMVFWAFVKFLQDFLLRDDIYYLRLSGYLIVIPMVLEPLFGFYAALGLGRQDYKLPLKARWLFCPASILILLMLTNEWHELVFYTIPSEPQPNVFFHPNFMLYVIVAFAMFLILARLVLIYRRSRNRRYPAYVRHMPLVMLLLLVVVNIPYILSSFVVEYEFLDYATAMFFLEMLVWETCRIFGLVAVNTRYEEAFERSTGPMHILDKEGNLLRRSSCTREYVNVPVLKRLLAGEEVIHEDTVEIQMEELSEGYVVWASDISGILREVRRLEDLRAELQSDSELLGNELATRSREETIRAKNRLYNHLSEEVSPQLSEMGDLLEELEETLQEPAEELTSRQRLLLRKLVVMGTYVKRRCNLRLIRLSGEPVTGQELFLGYRDLIRALKALGISPEDPLPEEGGEEDPEKAITLFDAFFFRYEEEVMKAC